MPTRPATAGGAVLLERHQYQAASNAEPALAALRAIVIRFSHSIGLRHMSEGVGNVDSRASQWSSFRMFSDPNRPEPAYLVYIDEAGDPGLRRVQPLDENGSSEWFTLGAVVVAAEREGEIVQWVREIKWDVHQQQAPDLHYRKLGLSRRIRAASILASKECRLFAVASHKPNMRGYVNERASQVSSQEPFYNWCVRILLERVTAWCSDRNRRDNRATGAAHLVFSERGGLRFEQLRAYHEYLRHQSRSGSLYLSKRDIAWDVLHPDLYDSVPHRTSAGAQLADVVASAFFQAAHAAAPTWTPASIGPALALRPRVAARGRLRAGFGVTLMPLRSDQQRLSADQRQVFEAYGHSFR